MRRDFGVVFVDDDEPGMEDRDWAIVLVGRTVIAAIKRSRVCPEVLAEAWVGFRQSEGEVGAHSLAS